MLLEQLPLDAGAPVPIPRRVRIRKNVGTRSLELHRRLPQLHRGADRVGS